MSDPRLIRYPSDIDDAWLSLVLARDVQITSVRRIGTGQMSYSNRVAFTCSGPGVNSVVVKQASDDDRSRAAGIGMRAYQREVGFYQQLAGRLGDAVPGCHLAVYDPADGWFTLVLDDVSDATIGDHVGGCTLDQAHAAMRGLAHLHAPVLGDTTAGEAAFLAGLEPPTAEHLAALVPQFLECFGTRVTDELAHVCRSFAAAADDWYRQRPAPLGLVHGDYRLDNLLFREDRCVVVDWQTVGWGPAMSDAAYFLGSSLPTEQRREHERALLGSYHDSLQHLGVTGLSWDECWRGYRREAFHGLVMPIVASMIVPRSERGDAMFLTWLARAGQQVLDLDSVEFLSRPKQRVATGTPPAPSQVHAPARPTPPPRAPLQPTPADDSGRHEPGAESMWNESWYFDAVNAAGDVGVYLRLGRLPNQSCSVYTLAVVGPGRPAVLLVDAGAPLPSADDDTQSIRTASLRAEHHCLEPLTTYRVRAEGTASAFADESAPLRGEPGTPVEVGVELTWRTVGTPYLWRRSTRYEIPCQVTGTVRVGDEAIPIDGPGQRDHSWGTRDWWGSDWVWSAFHLDDGTHTHSVTVPQVPGFAVGYTQLNGQVIEWTSGSAEDRVAASGLIESTRITTEPDGFTLHVQPLAFGALRMTGSDGQVTHFPRAMARVHTGDGRSGLGWIEWNRNQR